MRASLLLLLCLIVPSFAPPCVKAQSDAPAPAPRAAPLSVVTTTGMIADTTSEIGGTRVVVRALMGEGIDPHLYKPSPGDIRLLSGADLVLYNGLHLEGRMADMLEKLSSRKPAYVVSDRISPNVLRSPPEFKGNYDPHIWFDIKLWITVGERIREILALQDPEGAPYFNTNWNRHRTQLTELDAWAQSRISELPVSRRVLITAHDAFGYFGRAYGIEVLGIQGLSTNSEPSISDISHLVNVIVDRKLPAVFVESSVPRKTIEALQEGALAKGHQLKIGGELFSDAMGAPNTPDGTYIGMIRHNVNTIVQALNISTEIPAN